MGVKVRERPPGSGIWWVFIDHQGTRKAKKIGKDKKLALEAAKKIEAKLILGDIGMLENEPQKVIAFGEYAQTWIDVTVPATCKPSTMRDYRSILKNHILPVFGKLPVTQINRLMVKKFLNERSNKGFAPSTITHMKNALGGIFNLAIDDEVIVGNPAHKLGKVIRHKGLKIDIDPLTREELVLLMETFRQDFPTHYPLALTLARTGMRLGEALALQWGDIDFHGRFINIQRNISRGRIETPKNGKSRRIDMSQQLADVLRDLKHQRKIEAVNKGWGQIPEWIFINRVGKLLSAENWRKRVFAKALDKASLRKIRIHDLRHSYASQLIQAKESLAYVKEQLGHHSIKVTVDIYGHLAPEGNKAAVDKLDDLPATIRNLSATEKEKGLGRLT
jgi:integrase